MATLMRNETEVCKLAIEVWGKAAQIGMLAEESAELAVASLHMNREGKNKAESWENFAEEIADVELMIHQAEIIFPVLRAKVNLYKMMKLERIAQKLEKGKKL